MTNFQFLIRWETAAFARFIYGQTNFNPSAKSVVVIFRTGSRVGLVNPF